MENVTILVVEDGDAMRLRIRSVLEHAGFNVREASNGREALAQVDQGMPDLVILDLLLHEEDGFELASQIHAKDPSAKVPLIAYSGYSGLLDEARDRDLGFTDFLLKPAEDNELVATIKRRLEGEPAASA